MEMDSLKEKLELFTKADASAEEQISAMNEILQCFSDMNNRCSELEKSCNKIKQDYMELAINNRLANAQQNDAALDEPKPKKDRTLEQILRGEM